MRVPVEHRHQRYAAGEQAVEDRLVGEIRRHFRDRTWSVRVPRDLQETALKVERAVNEVAGDRDVRGVFWRYTPFPEELKEKLKNRGFVYSELAKRDKNRAMSDGY